jgi:predicted ATPase with chaperone activity
MSEDHFHTVGLPDAAVRESRDRVRSALKNCGYDIPLHLPRSPLICRLPTSGRKAPALIFQWLSAILGAYGGLNKKEIPDALFVGELSLDGSLRGVRGALPIAIEARRTKVKPLIVPEVNAREAAMVGCVELYPVQSRLEVIRYINSGNGVSRLQIDTDQLLSQAQQFHVDFKDVRGQQTAKRALEVACAGGHKHSDDWASRIRKNDAGETHADHTAAVYFRGSARDHQDSQCGGRARRARRTGRPAPFSRASSHYFRRRSDRRRCNPPAGRSFAGA